MASERKQIEATLRNKLARQYSETIEYHKKRASEYWNRYLEAEKKCRIAEKKAEELQEKVEQYEDWIERLQEFVNMPEGTREKAIKTYIAEQKQKEMFEAEADLFTHLFYFMR